jgi:hypothetical protein
MIQASEGGEELSYSDYSALCTVNPVPQRRSIIWTKGQNIDNIQYVFQTRWCLLLVERDEQNHSRTYISYCPRL